MKNYLIVESKGMFQSGIGLKGLELALELAACDHPVNLWLMQDAVQLLQLKSADLLQRCIDNNKISVFADHFTITQRGCQIPGSLDIVAGDISLFTEQLMAAETTPIWH